jgi:acyl-CoA reductase-like NAD-dependent aldehyde dehydrogenase
MTTAAQADIVDRHVRDALDRGARAVTGGRRADSGGGRFFEPTVLVDVDHSMLCMRDETFGPTIPIMKVRDVEEAVALANDSSYGLQASVWTRDTATGERIARRLAAGVVCVNDAQANFMAMELPQGGWKQSGLGSRHGGADGIRKYCRHQSLFITRFGPRREVHQFPYTPRRTRLIGWAVRVIYGWRHR